MTFPYRICLHGVLFVAVGLLTLAIPLLPLGLYAERMPMPDLFFAFTISWVVREKASAPLILVACLAIMADAILMRPVGLWALLILVTTELVRLNDRLIRDGGIVAEIIFFAAAISAAFVVQNVFLFLVFSETYPLGQLAKIVIFSVLCYPVFGLFLHYILRVRGPVSKNMPNRLWKVG